ncbi:MULTISPECIES: orotidine-5'-phosphate decarboxylase [unclassified Granulicatella]|uniref:orotidine-5'-phosphate decarboxylase n=1 Tax=unclassified Granulicatella TaxID=2630493 RepID=UPI0010733A4D|nr:MULTISPECIES: orotidine-5'-phosphate decarboxylase [unclassified Granulicatella]MBF0780219.1 orotidine-5'-phosphate decarboxylase [Granulicatella sp. 19428wC4_WM01]TFU95653.1 orotidine-5'-phosphate decarboxylase [Granulicatella sp. WM01]
MDRQKPIIALDFATLDEAISFLKQFPSGQKLNVKVGMELFYAQGSSFINELLVKGHEIFLDLKLHDIPNTVERSMSVLAQLGVSMVNVHAQGGLAMMKAALKGLEKGTLPGKKRPLLIAVTQLTSTDEKQLKDQQQISVNMADNIVHLAKLTKEAGLDGVVCSPHEVRMIKQACGEDFLTVTPGIRCAEAKQDDQVRIMTPEQARHTGSDYIVVGRPITCSENPFGSYEKITQDWSSEE